MSDMMEFDVQGTAKWIVNRGLLKVMRRELNAIATAAPPELYVLADSSVSAWDPDVIAAQHVGADGLVMYGRASVCKTTAFPVRHVFGRKALCVDVLAAEISRCVPSDARLIVLPHGVYWNSIDAIREAVRPTHSNLFVGELHPENDAEYDVSAGRPGRCCGSASSPLWCLRGDGAETCGRGCGAVGCSGGSGGNACQAAAGEQQTEQHALRPDALRMGNFVVPGLCAKGSEDGGGERQGEERGQGEQGHGQQPTLVVYIGEEGGELSRLMLEHAAFRFRVFSARSGRMVPEEALMDSARVLKRRYFLMMKTKDAERVGLVVATTAVAGYRDMLHRLKTVIRAAGKRPYVFYVGKINPAKLANFAEMDVLVLVASPETCAAVDTDEYWKPLITPFECEMALVKGRTWTGRFDFDFRPLLATPLPEQRRRGGTGGNDGEEEDEEDEVRVSLTNNIVSVRSGGAVMALSAGEVMMATRSFKGLDLTEGLHRPLDLVQGRVGIASGYSHEPSAVSNQLHHTKATDGSSVPEHMLGHASCINYVVPAASSDLADSASSRAGDKDPTRYSRNEEGAHRDSAASRDERGAHAGLQGSPAMDRDESRGRDDEDDANDMQRVAEDVDDFLALLAS